MVRSICCNAGENFQERYCQEALRWDCDRRWGSSGQKGGEADNSRVIGKPAGIPLLERDIFGEKISAPEDETAVQE